MELTNRAGRTLRQIRALNADAQHLEHHRTHLQAERFESEDRGWNHPPVNVTLVGPWKNRERGKILHAWGVPASHHGLETFVHFRDGGWGVFELPAMGAVHAYIAKAHKHSDMVIYIDLLCRLLLHSQYTLSEALSVIVDLADADPKRVETPATRAQEWEYMGRYIIDVLQARMPYLADVVSVGDVRRVRSDITRLSNVVALMRVEAAEKQLASVRATLALRRSS